MQSVLIAPSVNSLFVTGFLLLSILFIFIKNFRQFNNFGSYKKITILSLICIAIGVHGLIHLGAEYVYDVNPYKWF